MKARIGDLLIQYGIITQSQLDEALNLQITQKKRLGELLLELGYLTSKDLIWILSEQADIPFVELNLEMLDPDLVNRFPKKLLYEAITIPLYETDKAVFIAQGDPTDVKKTADIKAHTSKNVVVSGADPAQITHLLDKFFLSQKLRGVIQKIDDSATLRFVADAAQIELTDENGEIIHTKGSVDISIKYTSSKKSPIKDNTK